MNLQKEIPFRSEKYLAYIRTLKCNDCGWPPDMNGQKLIEAHHIKTGGMATKCGDDETVPLCGFAARGCHNKADKSPDSERKYQPIAKRLFEKWQRQK